MKTRLFSILVILAIGLAGITSPAQAQGYATSFTTSITYQNVGSAATTTLQILFYADQNDTTPITITRPSLAAGAGTSVGLASLDTVPANFKGSAVMQSYQPLLATLVQVPAAGGAVKNRPLSNGFAAGAPQTLIATVLKNMYGHNSIFSVQNVDSEANNINIKFYNTSAALIEDHTYTNVASGAAVYWDTGAAGDPLGTSFNGSAVVAATRTTGGADGAVVSSVMELEIAGVGAKSFEGVAEGATTYYMPSALCNYNIGGGKLTNTSYAVQNTSLTASASVNVNFDNGAHASATIGPGAKASFVACDATGSVQGYKGSATITATGASIIAMGKAYGGGLSTAFIGAAAGSGTAKVALPYVRWASDANYAAGVQQRTYITIQNIGAATITGNIVVQYLSCTGTVQTTHTITDDVASGAKVNSYATLGLPAITEFGICGTGYGGSVLITGPTLAELAVVARVVTQDTALGLTVGEDYNGINAP
jgi:hypothetical protein